MLCGQRTYQFPPMNSGMICTILTTHCTLHMVYNTLIVLSLHLSLLCLHMHRIGWGGALTARPLRTEEAFTVGFSSRPFLGFGVTTHRLVILMCYSSHTDIPAHTHTDVHVQTQTHTVCVALSPGPRVCFTVATVGLVHFIAGVMCRVVG